MSFVRVRDHALWVSDIYGNDELKRRIVDMQPGDEIELEVEGFRARWVKLPVHGGSDDNHRLKASGEAQRLWHEQRDVRWAGIVSVRICDD